MTLIKAKIIKYKHHIKELFILSFPLIIGNLGQTLIGATDVFVAAKHSINTLAAISIANSIVFTIFIIGIGLMASISIVLANYRGSRKPTKKFFQSSVNYSLILALIFCLITLATIPFIDFIGFEKSLIPHIKEYIFISSFSFFGLYLFQGIKEFLQAHEIVNFPNFVMMISVVLNLIFNFTLVFGFGPIPSLGVKGLALATLLVRTIMGLTLLIYCYRLIRLKEILNRTYIKLLLRIGYPIGFALLLEFLAFNMITLLVGRTGGVLAATHSIIATITSATFMIPLAVSNAIAIKVGYYNGAKNYSEIKQYSIVGITIATLFMFMCAIVLTTFPNQIISIFTSDMQIIEIGIPIILVAALFQVSDGFQVAASGVLKGLKMTKIVSACILSGYWLLGLPLGFILAYKFNYSLKGFWIGLAVSLSVIGIIMAFIIVNKFKNLKKEYCK